MKPEVYISKMSLDPLLSGVEKSLLMHNVGTKIKVFESQTDYFSRQNESIIIGGRGGGDFLQYLEQPTSCCGIVVLVHILGASVAMATTLVLYSCVCIGLGLVIWAINVCWVLCPVTIDWVVNLVESTGRQWCLRNIRGDDSWITLYDCGFTINVCWLLCPVTIEWVVYLVKSTRRQWCLRSIRGDDSWITLYDCGFTINVCWLLCPVTIEWVVYLVKSTRRQWCLRSIRGDDSWITLYDCGFTINVCWLLYWVTIEWVVYLVESTGRQWCLRNIRGDDSWIIELCRVCGITI